MIQHKFSYVIAASIACVITGLVWYLSGDNTTLNDKSGHTAEVPRSVRDKSSIDLHKNTLKKTSIEDAEHSTINLFADALLLHEKAQQGEKLSQYRLAQLMETCASVALFRDQMLDALSMLYGYADSLDEKHLGFIEQNIDDCADFNSGNLAMFLPSDMQNDSNYQSRILHDAGFISLVWLSTAASHGQEDALAEIMFHGPEALARAGMSSPKLQQQYLGLLSKRSPEAWLGIGACTSANDPGSVGLAIQTLACEQSQNCRSLKNYDALTMRQFLTNSLIKPQSQLHHEEVLSWFKPDYASVLWEQSDELENFSEIKSQVMMEQMEPAFQAELLEGCLCSIGLC
ncbi:hypothetical protein Q3O60_06150 [Alkalimonas collagenimarina]|uniref:Uncharacterized protein n=1 Tax=Alkalimonas collagenimarina TaxID=400390 RepID=A0ABT9GXG9_9GAMM|nr:hypothetical protein [Alkalimonas collagenimarina]MDP4535760.1 hypothetical protein [Alkalimonas collagenimarina]